MSPQLEIPGYSPYSARATCQLASDGMAFEFFVTDGTGDSYRLLLTAEEIHQLAQMRYDGVGR
ncbi:MAG TPA: hypothetical protein VLM91_25210 [Candidatus Methylomirabilis sp.]|nr:hypothetical protein [Candidatus Methylomirabilis sp.]